MDKMKMQTNDLADENFKKLKELFPNAVTETIDENGEVVRAIDKDVLRQEINAQVVDGPEERYQFTWPGKRESIRLAAAPIAAALRPCREESVNFDTTENVYIEGDNLDVLKLLRETYLGRVKMIYIDPPYNTGNDFIYEDDFEEDEDGFLLRDNQYDDQGNRLVQNTESNGRFHTDWLNMLYPRLKVAKDLLTDDGVIFISIDDNEQENLKKLCDEVFGKNCFVAEFVWEKMYTTKNDASFVSNSHEYLLCYSKNILNCTFGTLPRTDEMDARYTNPDKDPRGPWKAIPLYAKGESKNGRYPIVSPTTGKEHYPPVNSHWRYARETIEKMLEENRIYFGKDGNALPNSKRFLQEIGQGIKPKSFWPYEEVGSNDSAKKEIRKLFPEGDLFPFPKPSTLVYRCCVLGTESDSIVLDFFSGSATTAHAVMQLNAEDGGKRKFIMVQLPEVCEDGTEAEQAGYKNICEIGKERIRRAGKRIKEENPLAAASLDTGFRVFKLDSSNMKDVYYSPSETPQSDLLGRVDNIKEGRTPEDLLFQVMLEFGIPLSSKIKESVIAGKKVFNVEDNYLIACFDDDVTEETITAIAKEKPQYVVLRDSGFKTDSVAANFEQIFATYSPDTTRRVL